MLVCGPLSFDLILARELFALCLATVAVTATVLFRRGSPRLALLAVVVMAILLLLSLRPVYVEHWTPWNGTSHRHTLWELGHVH